jgi:hypothetical protein
MEKLLKNLIESAKKNRKGFKALQHSAITCEQYDLAQKLRELENEYYPESDEVKIAKAEAQQLSLAFRMVELNINEEISWLISQTLKVVEEKQGDFSIDDAAKLLAKQKELFLID